MEIVISPFSNSSVRDWPARSYAALATLLLDALPADAMVRIVGTASQALRADAIVRYLDPGRLTNECGRHPWSTVEAMVGRAGCVIGNNSGISHLAAALGVPTICIFGGSHARAEWRPVGRAVTLVSRAIWCSPCHLVEVADCPFDKACLRDIDPRDVFAAVVDALALRRASEQEMERSSPRSTSA